MIRSVSATWTGRARQAVLVLALLTCSSLLASWPAAQSNPLTVAFSPGAGTFVGSETVALTVQARADIHYTVDGSLPTVMSPLTVTTTVLLVCPLVKVSVSLSER